MRQNLADEIWKLRRNIKFKQTVLEKDAIIDNTSAQLIDVNGRKLLDEAPAQLSSISLSPSGW